MGSSPPLTLQYCLTLSPLLEDFCSFQQILVSSPIFGFDKSPCLFNQSILIISPSLLNVVKQQLVHCSFVNLLKGIVRMFASTLNASRLPILFVCFIFSSFHVHVICHCSLPKLLLIYKSPLFVSSYLLPSMYSQIGNQDTYLIKILYKIKIDPDGMSKGLFSGFKGLSLCGMKLPQQLRDLSPSFQVLASNSWK